MRRVVKLAIRFSDLAEVPWKWNLLISRTINFYKLKSFKEVVKDARMSQMEAPDWSRANQ